MRKNSNLQPHEIFFDWYHHTDLSKAQAHDFEIDALYSGYARFIVANKIKAPRFKDSIKLMTDNSSLDFTKKHQMHFAKILSEHPVDCIDWSKAIPKGCSGINPDLFTDRMVSKGVIIGAYLQPGNVAAFAQEVLNGFEYTVSANLMTVLGHVAAIQPEEALAGAIAEVRAAARRVGDRIIKNDVCRMLFLEEAIAISRKLAGCSESEEATILLAEIRAYISKNPDLTKRATKMGLIIELVNSEG